MILSLLLCALVSGDLPDRVFQRINLSIQGGPDFYLERSTDMIAIGQTLYIAENQAHRVQKFVLGEPIRHSGIVADKGEGPSEVWLPFDLAEGENGSLFIRDNRGISHFDASGRYLDRFRWYNPLLDYTVVNGTLYCATVRPDSTDLIDLCSSDGTVTGSIFPKYLPLEGEDSELVSFERYFYRGALLSNDSYLYYINATYGDTFKMDFRGNILLRRNVTDDFGPYGKVVSEKVREYAKNTELLLADQGYIIYSLFQDAALVEGKIYLLRGTSAPPDYMLNERDVFVFDAGTLELVERIRFPLNDGEFIWSFVVWHDGKERHIVLSLLTNDSDDYQLVELRP